MPPVIIAGPCSAESPQQLLDTARSLAAQGVRCLRAGVWKPRTKPGSFEGMGAQALEWLVAAGRATGMSTYTEVATPQHVNQALDAGVDALWLGARTVTNPFAVQEIADALASRPVKPRVLVKNPVNPDIELWTGAIERLRLAGVNDLGAVHRGFSTYGPRQWRNQPIWDLAIEIRRRFPDIPVITDPSHITGRADMVTEVAVQSIEMGFDGLMVEVHPTPATALSDNQQQLTPEQFGRLLDALPDRSTRHDDPSLDEMRRVIDSLDAEIIALLGRRFETVAEIGRYKREHNIPILQMSRYDDLVNDRMKQGAAAGLDPALVKALYAQIHTAAVKHQL